MALFALRNSVSVMTPFPRLPPGVTGIDDNPGVRGDIIQLGVRGPLGRPQPGGAAPPLAALKPVQPFKVGRFRIGCGMGGDWIRVDRRRGMFGRAGRMVVVGDVRLEDSGVSGTRANEGKRLGASLASGSVIESTAPTGRTMSDAVRSNDSECPILALVKDVSRVREGLRSPLG